MYNGWDNYFVNIEFKIFKWTVNFQIQVNIKSANPEKELHFFCEHFCTAAEFKEMMTFCSDTKGLTKSKYCLKWWKLKIIYWQVMKKFWSATLWTHRKLCFILLLNGYFSHVKYFDTKLYRGYELSIRSNANNYATVIYYRKPTKLLEGNVFSRVCPSVHSLMLTSVYRCNQPPSL